MNGNTNKEKSQGTVATVLVQEFKHISNIMEYLLFLCTVVTNLKNYVILSVFLYRDISNLHDVLTRHVLFVCCLGLVMPGESRNV